MAIPDPRSRKAPLERSNTWTLHPSRSNAIAVAHPAILPPTIPTWLPRTSIDYPSLFADSATAPTMIYLDLCILAVWHREAWPSVVFDDEDQLIRHGAPAP